MTYSEDILNLERDCRRFGNVRCCVGAADRREGERERERDRQRESAFLLF